MNAQSYIAYANDRNILKSSSSGGVFQVLAKKFISDCESENISCTVYGACQNDSQLIVKHYAVEKTKDIEHLIGSKYYQSQMLDIYRNILDELKIQGKKVLFSGTPCQVAGLKSFLYCNSDVPLNNLITIEVLCHGVSSRKVVMYYVEWLEEKSGKKISKLLFRTKRLRWYDQSSSMEIHYDDGTEKIIDRHVDPFYLAFNNNINLRPSCCSCCFARIDRVADLTIGDFWGAENYIKNKNELNDGISFVMVNNDKGKNFWNSAQDVLTAKPIEIEKVIPRNGAIITPAIESKDRTKFFDGLNKYNFNDLIKLCLGNKRLLKIRMKKIIGEERIVKMKKIVKSFHCL